MSEAMIVERVAQDFCTTGGNCELCNANIGFECNAKRIAKKVIDLGYTRRIEGSWVSKNPSYEVATSRTRFGAETYVRDFCSICGNRSKDVGNFCSHCGARLRRI